MIKIPSHILISRTDSIGDVVLTLPLAKVLKDYFSGITISFLGKNYTQPVIDACRYVDEFINVDDFFSKNIYSKISSPDAILHVFPSRAIAVRAKQLGIPLRLGTTNRLYHWQTCNELIKLSRKNSSLHEAQLNLKLLKAFGIDRDFSLKEIESLYGLTKIQPLEKKFANLIAHEKYNVILHPKSQGNGREWGLKNFIELINILDKERFKIFISGTEKEYYVLQPLFDKVGHIITDITGKMDLYQFISFINECNALVASGTGPIHIAAALGKDALGLYPPIHPVHPSRWKPLGIKSQVFVFQKNCNDCKNKPLNCKCMHLIQPFWVKEALEKIAQKNVAH